VAWVGGFERAIIKDYNSTISDFPVEHLLYCSPESFSGEPLDAATDVYHVGIILFQLVTGELLFRRIHPLRLMADLKSLGATVDLIADRKLRTLCLKCLQPKKEDRFANAAELFEAFLSIG
jgi:hypothetical protein